MTPRKKIAATRLLQGILSSQGRGLQVECLREDDEHRYEFLAWLGSKDRAAIGRVRRRAVDESSVNNIRPEVSALIHRFARHFSVVRSDPDDVQMFPRVLEGAELSVEGEIYRYVKGSGRAGAASKEVADHFLKIGLASGHRVAVTKRIKEILDHLTMRRMYSRLYRGRDGRYRFAHTEGKPFG